MGTAIERLGQYKRDLEQVQRALALCASALIDARTFAAGRLAEGAEVYELLTEIDQGLGELRALGMEV